tara:strand:- start:7268 stop:7942 length:675 start_codon:yes stop_codon:yes gene_type:complete
MRKKKNFFLWLFLFIFLTTYSFDSIENKKNSFLPIKIIKIEGANNSDQEEIQKRLNKFKGKSIILIGKNQFRKIGHNLKFVKELKIKKIYPDTIKVIIIEYEPIGIFFSESKKFLLTKNGKVIQNYQDGKFNTLPQVYGKNAKKSFHIFYKSLENTNFETELIKQFNYFDINRWDIILKNDKVVKLPTNNYENSLKKFLSIYKKENFNAFKIFDFRIKGQLILK